MTLQSKNKKEPDAELVGHEAVQDTIAGILAVRCGIPGCSNKHHTEEAGVILRKMIKLDLLKDDN